MAKEKSKKKAESKPAEKAPQMKLKTTVRSYKQGINVEKQKMKAYSKKFGTTVKSYQADIEVEKQKMGAYSKKMAASVKSLQNDFKKHKKDMKEAALNMRKDGIKNMSNKVTKFKGEMMVASKKMDAGVNKLNEDIKNQIKENKDAVAKIANGTKFLLSEINKKKKDFKAYAQGPFKSYIKAFWG